MNCESTEIKSHYLEITLLIQATKDTKKLYPLHSGKQVSKMAVM